MNLLRMIPNKAFTFAKTIILKTKGTDVESIGFNSATEIGVALAEKSSDMAFRIGKFVTKNKPDNPMGLHKIATKLAEHPTDYELAHKLIMDGTTGNAFVSRSSSSTKIGKILASQGHTLHAHGIAQRFITYKQYSNAAHIATSIISNNIKKENSENDRYERKFQLRMAINILNAIPFNQNNLNSIVEIIKALTEAGDEQSITEALNYCDRLQRKTPKKLPNSYYALVKMYHTTRILKNFLTI